MLCMCSSLCADETYQGTNVIVVVHLPQVAKCASVYRGPHYRNALTSTQPVWHFFCTCRLCYDDSSPFYFGDGLSVVSHEQIAKSLVVAMHIQSVNRFPEARRGTIMISLAVNFFFCCQQLSSMHRRHMLFNAALRSTSPTASAKGTVRSRKLQPGLHCAEARVASLIIWLRRHKRMSSHLASKYMRNSPIFILQRFPRCNGRGLHFQMEQVSGI